MKDISDPLFISHSLSIPWRLIELNAIRAQGAGGQNVNKVSTAIHLRFDIHAAGLPEFYQQKLLALADARINKDGIIIIKAQQYRTQELNRNDALWRLQQLIQGVNKVQKKRIASKPSRSSQRKRVDKKVKRGQTKSLRGRVNY